jgi:hypothetical protein
MVDLGANTQEIQPASVALLKIRSLLSWVVNYTFKDKYLPASPAWMERLYWPPIINGIFHRLQLPGKCSKKTF